jgi:hypothetical protein
MMKDMFTTAAALTDRALLARLHLLAKCDREITAELIAHLAELDARKTLVAEAHTLSASAVRSSASPKTPRTTGSKWRGRLARSLSSSTGWPTGR